MLEMPDTKEAVETEEQKKARLKAAQAKAHAKWRASDKGKAYYQRVKERRALKPEPVK